MSVRLHELGQPKNGYKLSQPHHTDTDGLGVVAISYRSLHHGKDGHPLKKLGQFFLLHRTPSRIVPTRYGDRVHTRVFINLEGQIFVADDGDLRCEYYMENEETIDVLTFT